MTGSTQPGVAEGEVVAILRAFHRFVSLSGGGKSQKWPDTPQSGCSIPITEKEEETW